MKQNQGYDPGEPRVRAKKRIMENAPWYGLKRWLAALLAALLIAAPLALPAFAQTPAEAKTQALNYIAESVKAPAFGSEWFVLAQARGGVKHAPYYKNYYVQTENYVKSKGNAKLSENRSTENSRLILALSSIGKNAADVGGYDLTAPLSDLEWLKVQGVNGPVNALLALDSGNYGTPQLRETLLTYILSREMPGGGWSFNGAVADADMTSMALQALAAYRDQTEVADALGRAVTALSGMQLANGSFGFEEDGTNAESTAQVVIAMAALGVNPMTDAQFAKAGGNPLSALLAYQLPGGGFKHKQTDVSANAMATDQAARALVAYDRFVKGESFIYANLYAPHAHVFGEWTTRTAVTCTAPGVEYQACGGCLVEENTRTAAALGHEFIDTVTPPTKKAGGHTKHICTRCGYCYLDSFTDKIKRTQGFGFFDWLLFIFCFGWIWME